MGACVIWDAVEQSEPEGRAGAGSSVGEEITGRILIIDDDPHFLRVLQRILSGEKFVVMATSNSCDAIGFLRSNNFDLIICDLRMPDCDGLNVLQAIRSAGNEIPVIRSCVPARTNSTRTRVTNPTHFSMGNAGCSGTTAAMAGWSRLPWSCTMARTWASVIKGLSGLINYKEVSCEGTVFST